MDLADEIKSIGDSKIASILLKLHALLLDYQITDLQNKVTDLERRVTEQEIYSSKDSIIIENLPTKNGIVLLISEQVSFFFKRFLGYKTFPGRLKACHYLVTRNKTKPAPVIVKFIYFE